MNLKFLNSSLFTLMIFGAASMHAMFDEIDKLSHARTVNTKDIKNALDHIDPRRASAEDRAKAETSLNALRDRIAESRINQTGKRNFFSQINLMQQAFSTEAAATTTQPQATTAQNVPQQGPGWIPPTHLVNPNEPVVDITKAPEDRSEKQPEQNQNPDQKRDEQQKNEQAENKQPAAPVKKWFTKKNVFLGTVGVVSAAVVAKTAYDFYNVDLVAYNNYSYVTLLEYLHTSGKSFNQEAFNDLVDAIKVLDEEEKEVLINHAMLGETNQIIQYLTLNKEQILNRVHELTAGQKIKMKISVMLSNWAKSSASFAHKIKTVMLGEDEEGDEAAAA